MKGKKRKIIVALSVLMTACMAGGVFAACGGGGNPGKPVGPFDESGFGGMDTQFDPNAAIETDANMTIDGKFDEAEWSQSTAITCAFDGDVQFTTKTLLGDKGVYVAFSVKDTKLYGNPNRVTYLNSCMEFNMSIHDYDAIQGNSAIQYRHDLAGQTERFIDKPNLQGWGMKQMLPVFSRMQVDGEINSGNSVGADFEVFVRWDALCDDYMIDGEVNPDFERPQWVGILPSYSRSSGPEDDDGREQFCSRGCENWRPVTYYRFGEHGYMNADAADAIVGDSARGINKSSGWKMEKTEDGESATSTIGYKQTTYFKGVTESDYAATALITYKGAYNNDSNPRFGMAVAADYSSTYAFVLSKKGTGFFLTHLPDRDISDEDIALDVCDGSVSVRMTVVKKDGYLFALVGDANTEKFGGTLVAIKQVGDLVATTPGLYTNNANVQFSDYEVKQGNEEATKALGEKISVLTVSKGVGGLVLSNQTYHIRGTQTTLDVETYDGYKLTALKVNNADVLNSEAFTGGCLTVALDADKITVAPTFEPIGDTLYNVTGKIIMDKDIFTRDISILIMGKEDKGYVYRPVINSRFDYTPEEANGALKEEAQYCSRYGYSLRLPAGTYTAVISYKGGIPTYTQEFTVDASNLELQPVTVNIPFGAGTNGVTLNADGSLTFAAFTWAKSSRVHTNAANNHAFATQVHVEQNFGEKMSAGVYFYVNDKRQYVVTLIVNSDRSVIAEISNYGDWARAKAPIPGYKLPASCTSENGYDVGFDLGLVYDGNGTYKILVEDELVYTFDNSLVVSLDDPNNRAKWDGLKSDAGTRTLGLATRDNGEARFTNIEYATDASKLTAMLEGYKRTVTVTVEGGNGTHDFAAGRAVYNGETVKITLTPDEGYRVATITVGGADATSYYDVTTGIFTLADVKENKTVVIVFEEIPEEGTVNGSYAFADWMEADDSVKVHIGNTEATVNASEKTYTASVPAGTYTVEISCDKYATVTKEITVIANDTVTVETPTFTLVKLDGYDSVTQGNDGSLTLTNKEHTFVGAQTNAANNHAFAVQAHVEHNFGGNMAGGFYLYLNNDHKYVVSLEVSNNRKVELRISNYGKWTDFKQDMSYTLPETCTSANGYDVGYDLGLIYDGNGTYKILVDGTVVYTFDDDTVVSWGNSPKLDGLKSDAGERTLGIVARFSGTARFTNIKYTIDASKVAEIFDEWTVSVTVEGGNGTHDLASDRVVYNGETVEITLTPNEGYRVATITVNNTDAMSSYNVMTGILTLANIREDKTVIITFEEIPKVGTVNGSYAFAEGLDADASVEVYIGATKATVNPTDKTYTASVPAGTYTVTVSCNKYVTVTKENVTVEEDGTVTVEALTFTLVKLSEYKGVTQNADGSLTFSNEVHTFSDAQTNADNNHAFAVQAHVEHNYGDAKSGGFYLYFNEQQKYVVSLIVNSDSVKLKISNYGAWTEVEKTIDGYTLPASCTSDNGYDVGYDLGLIYDGNGNYKVLVDGTVVYTFDDDAVVSWNNSKLDGLKSDAGAKTLGIVARFSGEARFSNIKYTFDETEFGTYYAEP